MKKLSTETIRNVLGRFWSELRHIWLVDKLYDLVDPDEMRAVVAAFHIAFQNTALDDCDDWSLQLHAYVRLRKPHWAFGEVIGYLDSGPLTTVHAMNIAICRDGVYAIDGKENSVTKLNEIDYKPFFVRM